MMEEEAESSRISLTCESAMIPLAAIGDGLQEPKEKFYMNSLMLLVGAVFASLALGVLLAYGICQFMFGIFRVHALSAARRGRAASVSVSAGS
jgi:ABC-type glycerol-3-phosphate transport system permease component